MRNDYAGFSLVANCAKWRSQICSARIGSEKDIEKKTLIRIEVMNLSYRDLIQEVKKLKKTGSIP